MPKLFQYGKAASGQSAGVMTRPTAGLNEYLPSNSINDTLFSDLIDVYPYKDECIKFYAGTFLSILGDSITKTKGIVRACIHSDESTSEVDVFYLMTALSSGWKIIKQTVPHSYAVSTTEFAMTLESIPSDANLVDSSSSVFKTEADTYYVFSNSHEKRIHFVKHTATENTYAYVETPAYPKKIVSHANRIFFIDTANKLWWCRAGDLYSWYSMEYDPDSVVASRNCGNGTFTILANPNTTRQLTATVTKTDTLDTLGSLTIVGTSASDIVQTEVLTLAEGRKQTSKYFKTVISITQSGWVQGGATPDLITVGVAPVGMGYVTDDAGYWTLEQELVLHDVCILGSSMYIFANHDIYIFQGYCPDNFSLTKIIADIGIEKMIQPNGYRKLSTGHNYAYFIYDGKVYEFDGNDAPRIISRPVSYNGQTVNGIFGGINFSGDSWTLESISDSLCLYDYSGTTAYYYLYNFESKTWWKMSGIVKTDINTTDNVRIAYIPSYDRQTWFTFLSIFSTVNGYEFIREQSITHGETDPFVASKAFNTNPSETGSLTEIILLLKGEKDSTADISVQYSLSVDADDFEEIKSFDAYIFSGDLETINIPMPIGDIANAHHYRIMLSIGHFSGTSVVYLYNIERRFRMKGRSR